ncbi:hypothetical protein [Lacinutrix sp. Hel_I_90]|uniref:hypothetical protein n=1 Tax=Lacinutrix sp. Hel_I_90 TaxID=1249999 RepID=UPI00069787BF|nr:hypothetical protein [Lacinutrix sp. Hel_I_90]
MKNIFLLVCSLAICFFSHAQEQPKVGDLLIVNEPSGQFYNHVSFPQINILVKRGNTPSYKSVYGNELVVEEVITKDNDKTYVVLKKKDGSKFFGFMVRVEANYAEALSSGELSLKNS